MRTMFVVLMIVFSTEVFAKKWIEVMGVHRDWDMNTTMSRFASKGVKQKNSLRFEAVMEKLAPTMIAVSEKNMTLLHGKEIYKADIQCLRYENGITRRDDVSALAVCFIADEIVMTIPFFKENPGNEDKFGAMLDDEYGDPMDFVPEAHPFRITTWEDTVMFIPKMHVSLVIAPEDIPGDFRTALVYTDVLNLNNVSDTYKDSLKGEGLF